MKNTMQKIMYAMIFLSAASTFSMEAPKKTDDLDPAIKLIRYFVHHMNGKVKKLTGVYEIDDAYLFQLYYSDNLSNVESNKKIRINFDKRQEKKILENYEEALKKYRAKKMLELTHTQNIFGPFLFCGLRENLSGKKIFSPIPKQIVSYMFDKLFGKKKLINDKKIERLTFDGLPFLFVKSMLEIDENQNSNIKIIKQMINNYKILCKTPEYKKIIKPYQPFLKLKMKDEKEKRIKEEFYRFIDGESEKYRKLFFDLETRTIKAIDHLINKYLKKPGHGFINLSFPEGSYFPQTGYDFSEKGSDTFYHILEKNKKYIKILKFYEKNNLQLPQSKDFPEILKIEEFDIDTDTLNYKMSEESDEEAATPLRELYLRQEFLEDSSFFISNSPNLQVLSIYRHDCNSEFGRFSHIFNAIKKNKGIKTFFFNKEFLHFRDAQSLFESLTHNPLTTLILNIVEWDLDAEDELHTLNLFFDFIKNNKTLLNVYCDFEQRGAEFEDIKDMEDYQIDDLKKKYINRIKPIEDSIIDALQSNKTLKSFSFSFRLGNDIKNEIKLDLNHFHESLHKNTSIEKLRLMPNDLCPNLDLTFKILQEQKYIRSLILDFYPKDNIESFWELLQLNKTITSLKLCYNFFQTEKDILGFFNSMDYNQGILRLKITKPSQEKGGILFDSSLSEYLKKNKTLQFLQIDLSFAETSTLDLSYISEALNINKESQIKTLFFTDEIDKSIDLDNEHLKYKRLDRKCRQYYDKWRNYDTRLRCNNRLEYIKRKLDIFYEIIKKIFFCNVEKYSGMPKIRLGKRIENNNIQIENPHKQEVDQNDKKRKFETINNNLKEGNQNKHIKSNKKTNEIFIPDFKSDKDILNKIEKWKNARNSLVFEEKVHSLYMAIDECAKNHKDGLNFVIQQGMNISSSDKFFFENINEDFFKKEKVNFINFIKKRINSISQIDSVCQKNSPEAFNIFICINFPSAFHNIYNSVIKKTASSQCLFFLAQKTFYSNRKISLSFIKQAANKNHLASSYLLSLMALEDINNQEIEYQKKIIDTMLFFKVNHLLPDHFSSLLPNNFREYDFLISPNDPIHIPSIIECFEKISCIAKVEFEKALKMFGFSNQDKGSK